VKFGEIPVTDAVGAILVHTLKAGDRTLRKGRVLTLADVAALATAGHHAVVAARLEPGEIGENSAATQVARAIAGRQTSLAPAFTGRVNILSEASGICVIDRARVDRFNLVDETITLATIEPFSVVAPKQMLATVKVIPFGVRYQAVDACIAAAADGPLVQVASFQPKRVALIQTRLPGLKESILDKTVDTMRARLAALGTTLSREERCEHRAAAVAPLIAGAIAARAELVLVAGASAIVDRRDVIPAAIAEAGGAIDHFGMPVDPGNLMLIGHFGAVPVLGLPGCARSAKVNGFDWVLQRLLAGLPAGGGEIMRMGVGGLLADVPSRPFSRATAGAAPDAPVSGPQAPRVAALVLAAGLSRRMGTLNKLLIGIDGKPMVRHVAEAAAGSEARPLIVVTGHEREKVEAALAGLDPAPRFVFNPDAAAGLSTSVKCGLAALPPEVDGAVVCLGDMPKVTPATINGLIAAFNPVEGRAICVPVRKGKRGNPVLLARPLFAELAGVSGDVGARDVVAAHPELVAEVEMENDGVLIDIDTPQALAHLATAKIGA
jgi:molybdenum cofactor cytidylyltransferase